jgi:hypothetical protein
MGLERTRSRPLGVALIDEFRHGVQQVLPCVDHGKLALQLRQLRFDVLLGAHFLLNGLTLRVQLVLLPVECLCRGLRIALAGRARFAAQELRVGPRDFEGEADDFIGRLAIGEENQ